MRDRQKEKRKKKVKGGGRGKEEKVEERRKRKCLSFVLSLRLPTFSEHVSDKIIAIHSQLLWVCLRER